MSCLYVLLVYIKVKEVAQLAIMIKELRIKNKKDFPGPIEIALAGPPPGNPEPRSITPGPEAMNQKPWQASARTS